MEMTRKQEQGFQGGEGGGVGRGQDHARTSGRRERNKCQELVVVPLQFPAMHEDRVEAHGSQESEVVYRLWISAYTFLTCSFNSNISDSILSYGIQTCHDGRQMHGTYVLLILITMTLTLM